MAPPYCFKLKLLFLPSFSKKTIRGPRWGLLIGVMDTHRILPVNCYIRNCSKVLKHILDTKWNKKMDNLNYVYRSDVTESDDTDVTNFY